MSGNVQFGSQSDPSPYLTKEEEEEVVTFLFKYPNIGYEEAGLTHSSECCQCKRKMFQLHVVGGGVL